MRERAGRRHSGFSMVELIIAITILSVAIIAYLSVINSSTKLQTAAADTMQAHNAARHWLETARAYASAKWAVNPAATNPFSDGTSSDFLHAPGLSGGVTASAPYTLYFNVFGVLRSDGTIYETRTIPVDSADLEWPSRPAGTDGKIYIQQETGKPWKVTVTVRWSPEKGRIKVVHMSTYIAKI